MTGRPPARHITALADAGVTCWAGKGYRGAGGPARVPHWGRWETLSPGEKAVNRSHAKIRALVDQAVATLKSWRPLRKLRCSTTRITSLVPAAPALHLASSERCWKALTDPHCAAPSSALGWGQHVRSVRCRPSGRAGSAPRSPGTTGAAGTREPTCSCWSTRCDPVPVRGPSHGTRRCAVPRRCSA